MKTRKNNLILLPLVILLTAFVWLAQDASAQILKPGELIYSRAANVGENCSSGAIWAVGQDGSNDRFIAQGHHPRISPDGRYLMFKRFSSSSLCSPFSIAPEWWIRDLARRTETQMTFNFQPSSGHFFSPETNRDGRQVVFNDGAGLCEMNRDGTNKVCVNIPNLDPIRGAGHPSVRGSDNLLLVQNFLDNADGGLYTLDYDTLQNRQKIPNTIGRDLSPSWSNDGMKIAFAAYPTTRAEPYFFTNLFKINADGSSRTQLTTFTQPFGEGFSYSLIWTKDNQTIINAAKLNGVAGIYKIAADGSGTISQIPITAGAAPEWVGGIAPVYSEQETASFGGGLTTSGNFSLVSTIGQAFAGQTSTDGTYNLQSGFWAGVTASAKNLFDFDGDGKADVSVFRPSNGTWYLLQSNAGFTSVSFGLSTDKIAPADYDGDGKTDIAVYRDGTWYLQRSNSGFLGISFGAATDTPVPADFDGDGKAEIAVFRPSNGGWYVYNLATNQTTSFAFGQSGDVPLPADYDGDGKADIAVFRSGVWYLQRSSLGFTGIAFGAATDEPVPADFDGDGKTDVAVFRPSSGAWYLQQSTSGFAGTLFGQTGDLPVAADYDGDGKADVAVFRGGNWYLQQSTAGFTGVTFGAATDKPVPNAFVP